MADIEQRVIQATELEVRRLDDGRPTLRGFAAMYNSLSEDLGGFREVIAPGAFRAAFSEDADVKAFWNHNSDYVLGRTTSGTLRLIDDERGLMIEIDPPASAANFIEAVTRGDVSQMSFGFAVAENGDSVEITDDGTVLRTLREVDLFEVSPVAMPAYPATSISARTKENVLDRVTAPEPEVSEVTRARIRMKRKELERKL